MHFVKTYNSNNKEKVYKFEEANHAYKFAGDIIQSSDCGRCLIVHNEIFGEEEILTTIIGRNEIKFK